MNLTSEQSKLTEYIITKIAGHASGQLDDECEGNLPRDVYFIGNLSPKDDGGQSLAKHDMVQKLSPSAFGAEFRIKCPNKKVQVKVQLGWACYYRLFPSFKEQIAFIGKSDENEGSDRREEMYLKFKKIECQVEGIIVLNLTDNKWNADVSSLTSAIDDELKKINGIILRDPNAYKIQRTNNQIKVPRTALTSEKLFNDFVSQFKTLPQINWKWEVKVESYIFDNNSDEYVVLLQFVNSSELVKKSKLLEPFFFNPKASFQFADKVVIPFELELAPKSFRYDREMYGKGFNCGITRNSKLDVYETTNVPTYIQNRYSTQTEPSANFSDLLQDPVPVLENILSAMHASLNEWQIQEIKYKETLKELWELKHSERYRIDQIEFQKEIERFKKGILLIKNDDDIRKAFDLTNKVFLVAGKDKNGVQKKRSWRLFQIVFIVTEILSIAALKEEHQDLIEERKKVDIIYFPTGGGKTEAYLGALVFHCFFDRLRGKTAGLTAWIRFPLKLLTIQQTQRLTDVIGICELVRKQQTDSRLNDDKRIRRFSVGYYVGSEGTPNDLSEVSYDGVPSEDWSTANDTIIRQKWKRIVYCPSCKTNTVTIDFDASKIRVLHRCTNVDCKFENGIIPIYIIDSEIYRYLPTVLVGTIDKLSVIGFQRRVSMMFGKIDGFCVKHGFYNGKCSVKTCTDSSLLKQEIPGGFSGPTLFIQDELHLLREGVGTFDSHYETFAQKLLEEFNEDRSVKIIASSATIEKYERQVEHLYGKNFKYARLFPSAGPTNNKSFYAETRDYPQRIFAGILPHNKTILRATIEILEYYHSILQTLARLPQGVENPFGGESIPGTSEWFDLLDFYYSSLTYFQATKELDKVKTEIETYINNERFKNLGYEPIAVKQLTGDTTSEDVTKTLEMLETKHSATDPHEAVLATSMVSHGVDIDRLNTMLFYGMPKANAEYIQASSRVGRTHVGLVINLFSPTKERDQSHYAYFEKYHEFLGQLVEPVAINRWSAYGIDKTLPGLFVGVLLQIYSNRDVGKSKDAYYFSSKISKMYINKKITKEDIKKFLTDAYVAGLLNDKRNDAFITKIDKSVDVFFDNILNTAGDDDKLSSSIFPPPMTSLRDIDEQIKIQLDPLGVKWHKS